MKVTQMINKINSIKNIYIWIISSILISIPATSIGQTLQSNIHSIEHPVQLEHPAFNKIIMNELNIDQLKELIYKMEETHADGGDQTKEPSVIVIFPENYMKLIQNLNKFNEYISHLEKNIDIYSQHYDDYIKLKAEHENLIKNLGE